MFTNVTNYLKSSHFDSPYQVCMDFVKKYHEDWTECDRNGWERHEPDDGACYTDNGTMKAIWNQRLARTNGIRRTLPAEEYYE